MSRYVIIGGGIAGLAFACAMKKDGHEVIVCDRDQLHERPGHGFLVHPDAIRVLREITGDTISDDLKGCSIHRLILRNNHNKIIEDISIDGWMCMRRSEPVRILSEFLGHENIRYNYIFKEFIKDENTFKAAIFNQNDIIEADFFIGADGSHSLLRQMLFGKTNYSDTLVKEILGTNSDADIITKHKNTFRKYLSHDSGLAFGSIPCSEHELIWFLQFDVTKYEGDINCKEGIHAFMKKSLSGFPDEVHEILDSKSSVPGYIWNTTDFEPLPAYHLNNAVLIGDAAHLSLPFTSAGVTNALFDAKCLADMLSSHNDFSSACNSYHNKRAQVVKNHLYAGRQIRDSFIRGSAHGVTLPLIKEIAN